MFGRKLKSENHLPAEFLPNHVAIIMDGNGRWAKKRGLPRTAGHSIGTKTFESICRYANRRGIRYLTFYAFSTENWKRPQQEVETLMNLFRDYLSRAKQFTDENIRVHFVGDPEPLSDDLRELMASAESASAEFTGLTINIAINYGGRDELVHAMRTIGSEIRSGALSPEAVTEQVISDHTYTPECPQVDLLIRPGGESRVSNFLLWQIAYAELYFCDTLWPDFTHKDLEKALTWYGKRNRRFGGV